MGQFYSGKPNFEENEPQCCEILKANGNTQEAVALKGKENVFQLFHEINLVCGTGYRCCIIAIF